LSSGSTFTSSDIQSVLLQAWSGELAVDHHCHPLHPWPRDVGPRQLRAVFTEAVDTQILDEHVPALAAYRDAIRRLAEELECERTEDAVLKVRAQTDPATYANRLLSASATGMLLLDSGYTSGEPFSLDEHARQIRVPQREVVRLELLAERYIESATTPADWLTAVRAGLREAVNGGAVGVKTISAYRAGLALRPVGTDELGAAFAELQKRVRSGGSKRIAGDALCYSLLADAAEEIARLGVPLQVHCGFGDNDEDLGKSNPLGLRPLLTERRYEGLRLVLLHCYPFHREAAYLCSVYRHAYMDLSLTLPLAALDGQRAMREVLGLCPWTKVLYASDASRLPEIYFVAAAVHREALAGAFGEFVDHGILSRDEAVAAGVQVLSANALRVYKL
jgi:predicted TIM-barrel fold metal-dependent hydrolase